MSGTRRKPGSLGPHVEGYRAWLLGRGYSPSAVVHALGVLGHLGRWMQREGLMVDDLNAARVSAFIADYRRDAGRLPSASVWRLLDYLRADGAVAAERPAALTVVERLVGDYREWLLGERGLAAVTVSGSERLARRFLAERVGPGDSRGITGLTAGDVNGFLLRESARVRPGTAGCFASQLRSLLRYLAVRGLADPGLAEAVPSIARWREATIPEFPARPQIARILASCDRQTVAGARDYAVLMLLARLGLRAVEVSRLRLEDLDWRAGEIMVEGKARQRGRLPLFHDVGEALVSHLARRGRHDRQRRVFLTVHAPVRALEAAGVRTIVRNACRRAGVEHVAAHRLRHALASELLREGASLIAIGQVLRHRHLASTAIYAKVDLQRLRLVARPWPGADR
jgi:site-specific recombinase XerD